MMRKIALAVLFLGFSSLIAFGADFNGKWTAQFDTQVGQQNYTYEFHVDGAKLTGKPSTSSSDPRIFRMARLTVTISPSLSC